MQHAQNTFFNATQVHSAITCVNTVASSFQTNDNFVHYYFAVNAPYSVAFNKQTLVLERIDVTHVIDAVTLAVTLVFKSAQRFYLEDAQDDTITALINSVNELLNIQCSTDVYSYNAANDTFVLQLTPQ
jgi:hypothetical protein